MWLTHDPAYPDEQPTAPLARYTYTASGELRAVYDRSGTQVRGFTYDAEHAGRMVAHHYAGRPESRYRYDDTGRVTEQVNPEGLDYRFEYGDPIGLRGGWNMYQYPLNPIQVIDPMGLDAIENMTSGGLIYAVSGVLD